MSHPRADIRFFHPYITLQKLEILSLIGKLRSVTRTAEQLGLSQPAVSAHLRDIEDKLGVRLVARAGRNIVLTEAGERVYRWAFEVVARGREVQREISSLAEGTAGSAVVAASTLIGEYVLPNVLVDFIGKYPDAVISTHVLSALEATHAVRSGACDFSVMVLAPRQDLDGLVAKGFWEEKLLLVAAADSRIVTSSITVTDLATLPFIDTPTEYTSRQIIDGLLHAHGIVRRNVFFEIASPEGMKRAVRADIGVCFLMESAVREDLDRGLLRVVEIADLSLVVPIYLVHRRYKTFSPLQTVLIDFVRRAMPPCVRPFSPSSALLWNGMEAREGPSCDR